MRQGLGLKGFRQDLQVAPNGLFVFRGADVAHEHVRNDSMVLEFRTGLKGSVLPLRSSRHASRPTPLSGDAPQAVQKLDGAQSATADAKRDCGSARRDRRSAEGIRGVEDIEGEDRECRFGLHRPQSPS